MKSAQLKRSIAITNATWATNAWTLTTDVAHYLSTGDTFTIIDPYNGSSNIAITCIAGTTASTIVFTSTNQQLKFPASIYLNQYGTGVAESNVFNSSFSDSVNGLVHVVSLGTATCTAKLQGSLDNSHWIDHGTATAVTAGSQLEIVVTKPYPYLKVVFTVAPASAGGGNNTNTIKVFRANV